MTKPHKYSEGALTKRQILALWRTNHETIFYDVTKGHSFITKVKFLSRGSVLMWFSIYKNTHYIFTNFWLANAEAVRIGSVKIIPAEVVLYCSDSPMVSHLKFMWNEWKTDLGSQILYSVLGLSFFVVLALVGIVTLTP